MVQAKLAKQRMVERGLKTAWVAGKIGVGPDTLSRFLNGKINLGKPALILLAQVLEIKEQAS